MHDLGEYDGLCDGPSPQFKASLRLQSNGLFERVRGALNCAISQWGCKGDVKRCCVWYHRETNYNFHLLVLGMTHWIGAIPSKVFSGRT